MRNYEYHIGIDISKATFDVINHDDSHQTYTNDVKGFAKFVKTIPENGLCTMEYTGIYYIELAKYLYKKGIPVSVVNPLRIKHFIQMQMKRNKTDKSDAQLIKLYSQQQSPSLWKPESKLIEQSKDIYQTKEQYIEFRIGLKNKLDGLVSKKANKKLIQMIENQIESISISIVELEKEIDGLMNDYNAAMLKNISSIKGIGSQTASLLIMSTNGFNGFDKAKQLSSFFGLAPTEKTSGTSINGSRRISKIGNPLVRKKLYMCSLQASRSNKACKELYQRLLAKGKPPKLALIAVANKLLRIVFAIAKSGIPYDPEYKSYIRC